MFFLSHLLRSAVRTYARDCYSLLCSLSYGVPVPSNVAVPEVFYQFQFKCFNLNLKNKRVGWQRPILVSCWSRVPFPAWVLWVMCSPQALTVTRQSRSVRRRGCRLSILGAWLYWIVREVRLARPRERGASHKTHCAKRTMKIRYGGCIWFSTRSGTMSWFLPKAPFVR